MNLKKIPTGVRIIAILYYIAAAISLLVIPLVLFFGRTLFNLQAPDAPSPLMLIVITSVFAIIAALINFYIGRGLMRGKNWVRIIVIVLGALAFLSGIFSVLSSPSLTTIIPFLINALIVGYLLLSSEVKAFFHPIPLVPPQPEAGQPLAEVPPAPPVMSAPPQPEAGQPSTEAETPSVPPVVPPSSIPQISPAELNPPVL